MKTPVSDIGRLVIRATSPDDELRERDEAFADLVARFQDATYACAYSVLGDPALAEDAAQDAFIAAWLNLRRLREPEAFGGWLRRIVLRESTRRLRDACRSLPLEAAGDVASEASAPADEVERREMVRSLLASLPEHERETAVLFYMGGHSQRDIAASLGVSVTAVKQRLHSARQRLKRREAEIMGELGNTRPSRDDRFREQLNERLRPIRAGDYTSILSLVETIEPGMELEHAEWLYNRQQIAASGLHTRSFVAEDATTCELLAYGAIEQESASTVHRQYGAVEGPSEVTRYRVHLVVRPGSLEAGVGRELYERLESEARSLGATSLWLRETTDAHTVLDLLSEEGFSETDSTTEWRYIVETASPPVDNDPKVVVSTISNERQHNPHWLEDLQAFWNEPAVSYPKIPYTLGELERIFNLPHIVPDSYFVARRGHVVGVMNVWHPHEATPKDLPVGMRIMADSADTGVEQAMFAKALDFASRHSMREFVTQTTGKPDEAPAVYRRLGFQPTMQMVTLSKELT